MRKRCYQIILEDEASEALVREARKKALLPSQLINQIVRNWLVRKGNLRIY